MFPALGIKKNSPFVPSGVYLAINDKIDVTHKRLICAYKAENTDVFRTFERDVILSNSLFEYVIEADGFKLYIFNLSKYEKDYELFLLGKYSKLSKELKKLIREYYGETSSEYSYIESYLYPERFVGVYAKLLDVEVSLLIEVGELCDKCDPKKETLSIQEKEVALLK